MNTVRITQIIKRLQNSHHLRIRYKDTQDYNHTFLKTGGVVSKTDAKNDYDYMIVKDGLYTVAESAITKSLFYKSIAILYSYLVLKENEKLSNKYTILKQVYDKKAFEKQCDFIEKIMKS